MLKDIFIKNLDDEKKNIIWNIIGTTFNAFNSLFFMIVVTRINGIVESGIFTMAFSLACLFCIIGGYEGRVYQVTDVKHQFSEKEYIFHRYITCLLTIFIVIGYMLIQRYDSHKAIITLLLCLTKLLEVLADVYYSVLQKNNKLFLVGKSLFYKSLLSVFTFFIVDLITSNLVYACFSLVVIWLFVFVLYDYPRTRPYYKSEKKTEISKVFKLFKYGFFAFTVLFLANYLVNAPKYALDTLIDSSLQAIFGIILLPATFLSLAAQYLIQPILTRLATLYSLGEKAEFKRLVRIIMVIILIFGLICLLLAYFFGIPLLNLLYGVHIDSYKKELCLIILGAICYSFSTFLSAVLTTVRYTFVQFIISVICSVFGLVVSPILITQMSISGAALSYLCIMCLQFIMYMISYATILNKRVKFEVNI